MKKYELENIMEHIEQELSWLVEWHNKNLTKEQYYRASELLDYIRARLFELKEENNNEML